MKKYILLEGKFRKSMKKRKFDFVEGVLVFACTKTNCS